MEPDIGIINDLIKNMESLEDSISKLRIEIVKKQKELKETKPLLMENFGKIEDPKKKNEEEEDLELKSTYTSLKRNELQIKSNIMEYTIEYITSEQINTLYIMGDFTNWELKEMNKNKDIFSYTIILVKGFKYYYSLQSNDEIILDFENPIENNPKNNQAQNVINLCKNDKVVVFDYKQHENILNIAKRNLYLLKMENYDEISFLNSLAKNSESYTDYQNKTNLEKNIFFDSLNKYFDEKEKELKVFSSEEIHKIMTFFYDRIIIKKNKDNSEIYYQIIQDLNDQFKCVQLYDSNHIKINRDYYINNKFFFDFSMSLIAPSRESNKNNEKIYTLLSKEESNKILDEYAKDNNNILKVYHNPISIENEGYYGYGPMIVYPLRIEPSNVNMNDYLYEAADNHIIQVKNIKDNTFVLFVGNKEIKQKKNKPIQFKIYYQIYHRNVVIIHSHILDKSLENKTIDMKYIDHRTDYRKIKKEHDYIKKETLLLLIRSLKPFKLYYKGKKIQMESENIILNGMYKINSPNQEYGFNNMIVKIENIPNYSLNLDNSNIKSNNEIFEKCDKIIFEKPNHGVVDVKVLFDERKNIVNEIMKFALTPCLLVPLNSKEAMQLEKKYNEKDKIITFGNDSYEIQKMEIIVKNIEKYKKYINNEEEIKKLSNKDKDIIIFTLEDYKNNLTGIGRFIEKNELWELIDKVSTLGNEIDEILKSLK